MECRSTANSGIVKNGIMRGCGGSSRITKSIPKKESEVGGCNNREERDGRERDTCPDVGKPFAESLATPTGLWGGFWYAELQLEG